MLHTLMFLNKIRNKKQKGAAALLTLIILSTVLLLAGITLVLNSIDLNKSLKGFQTSQSLYIKSRSCFEDAMSKIQFNSGYTGTSSITSSGVTCQATVTINSGNSTYRDIAISANNGEFYYTDTTTINTTTNPISIVL